LFKGAGQMAKSAGQRAEQRAEGDERRVKSKGFNIIVHLITMGLHLPKRGIHKEQDCHNPHILLMVNILVFLQRLSAYNIIFNKSQKTLQENKTQNVCRSLKQYKPVI